MPHSGEYVLEVGCYLFRSSKGRGKGRLRWLMYVHHTGFAGHTWGLREPGVGKLPLGKRRLHITGRLPVGPPLFLPSEL